VGGMRVPPCEEGDKFDLPVLILCGVECEAQRLQLVGGEHDGRWTLGGRGWAIKRCGLTTSWETSGSGLRNCTIGWVE